MEVRTKFKLILIFINILFVPFLLWISLFASGYAKSISDYFILITITVWVRTSLLDKGLTGLKDANI